MVFNFNKNIDFRKCISKIFRFEVNRRPIPARPFTKKLPKSKMFIEIVLSPPGPIFQNLLWREKVGDEQIATPTNTDSPLEIPGQRDIMTDGHILSAIHKIFVGKIRYLSGLVERILNYVTSSSRSTCRYFVELNGPCSYKLIVSSLVYPYSTHIFGNQKVRSHSWKLDNLLTN